MNNVHIFQMEYMYKSVVNMQREVCELRKEVGELRSKENLSQIDICGLKDRYNYLEETSVSNINKIQILEAQNMRYEQQIVNMKSVITVLTSKQAYDAYALDKKLHELTDTKSPPTYVVKPQPLHFQIPPPITVPPTTPPAPRQSQRIQNNTRPNTPNMNANQNPNTRPCTPNGNARPCTPNGNTRPNTPNTRPNTPNAHSCAPVLPISYMPYITPQLSPMPYIDNNQEYHNNDTNESYKLEEWATMNAESFLADT